MSTARYIVGDTRKVLAGIPDNSVDLVLTSPPFLALRSYLPADHPDKQLEMGSEATPGEFIDALLDVVEECRRVLTPHGSICIELGDTYAGSGGAGGDYGTKDPGAKALREGQPKFNGSAIAGRRTRNANRQSGERNQRRDRPQDEAAGILTPRSRPGPAGRDKTVGWPLDKSLGLVPELFRVALAYGLNPLTGRTTEPWRVRNVVRWCRPNPPVGALADKFRPATSDMVIACTARDRYFDLDAVRTSPELVKDQRRRTTNGPKNHADPSEVLTANYTQRVPSHPAGAPPLDHWWIDDIFDQDAWLIPTQPYEGSHYATWPEKLCVRPIEAMCPRRVCTTCGQPSRRIVKAERTMDGVATERPIAHPGRASEGGGDYITNRGAWGTQTTTLGWTDCGCPGGDARWRPGVVLDPFAGSGTTLAVATGHGRDAIGIDLDSRNALLAEQRIGPLYLTIEHHGQEVA